MILQSLNDYIKAAKRVDEAVLLKHFRLTQEGLAPMMAVLLKRGYIQKTINQRGAKLTPIIYYSYVQVAQIPTLTVI
ncbi:FeoC-like transcriptional regulator [Psychromonas sp. MME2]|uniref:FeoC-like transcriptional regulator n=1 Tax=unclassified Psychromonas TaxID=2614957 RepID=UPI00339C97E8